MLSTPSRIRSSFLSLLVAVMSLLPPPGSILCVGLDGHLVIELAATPGLPCCVPQADAGQPDSCGPAGCRDCQDLSLSIASVLRVRVQTPSLTHPALAAPSDIDPFPAEGRSNALAWILRSTPPPPARPLDTILLRI
jgi:hypothetical protein